MGTGITVNISGLTLEGDDSENYSLTQPATTANITQKALSATGITASNKVYDSTTDATLNYTGAGWTGLIGGDSVTLEQTGTGTFASEHVGTGITVNITGLTISGTDAENYNFTTTASTSANITVKALSATGITASNKTYDSTTDATLNYNGASLSGKITNDDVTLEETGVGTFAQEHVRRWRFCSN